jgi:hypothetical protein
MNAKRLKNIPKADEVWYVFQPSGRGGIGRHARLRIWWRKPWGFKSLRPHQKAVQKRKGTLRFFQPFYR